MNHNITTFDLKQSINQSIKKGEKNLKMKKGKYKVTRL